MPMKKQDAVKLFGSTLSDLGKALGGKGRSAISQWPDDLTEDQINMVIGAAVRRGIYIPESILKNIQYNQQNLDHLQHKRRVTDHFDF
jgi:hypothetical protein